MPGRTTLTASESAFIARQRVAHLATASAEGTPHLIPICYAFDAASFYTPLDEKPKSVPGSQLQRVRNIEARHEASLLIDQYDDDWTRLGYVLIHARAKLIGPKDEVFEHAIKLLRKRYQQYRRMALEKQQIILLTPDRVTSWGPALHPDETSPVL